VLEPQPLVIANTVAIQKIQREPLSKVEVDEKCMFVTQDSFLAATEYVRPNDWGRYQDLRPV